jgi:phenylpropionate dioxygenase-like ring-hydroxylating dioxygenase large terminal subunit
MEKGTDFKLGRGWSVVPDAGEGDADYNAPHQPSTTDRPDPSRYYHPEFAAREWDRMWTRIWTLAGPVSDVPDPGDYFLYELGRESIIIVRTGSGEIKAFYNVCPHRGNQLAFEDFGSVSEFSCAFHTWKFSLDGRNTNITDSETFHEDVLCHGSDLTELRCEIVAGLIFVNMDDDAGPVREFLGPIADALEVYAIDEMHAVRHVRSVWAANWKTGADAFYELYHLHAVHPETQCLMEDYHAQYDTYPNGMSRMIVPFAKPSPRFPDQETVNEGIQSMLLDAGIDPASFKGTAQDARAAIPAAKRERARKIGLDYDKFTDAQLSDSFPYGIFPNVQIGSHPEGVLIMKFMPHPADPEVFTYDTITMVKYVDDPDYKVPGWMGLPEGTDVTGAVRPDIEHVPLGVKPDLGLVLDQDSELLPLVQKGIRSRGFKGPLWSEQEIRLRHYQEEVDRYVNGEK